MCVCVCVCHSEVCLNEFALFSLRLHISRSMAGLTERCAADEWLSCHRLL